MSHAHAGAAFLAAATWAVLVGCPGPGGSVGDPTSSPVAAKVDGGAVENADPARPLGFVACGAPRCMVHTRTGAYHLCLNASRGICISYGASCEPVDTCMYDPASRSYRQCGRALAGTCAEPGQPCNPKDRCMLDPVAERHRTCAEPVAGGCRRYGAVCEPG